MSQFHDYKQYNMQNKSFILLISFLLFSISQQSQILQLQEYNCLLIYNRLADNSLSLDHCQSINNNTKKFTEQSWLYCVSQCCGLSSQTYPNFNQNSLAQCKNNNQILSQTNNVVKIVIITMCTIVGFFLLIAILRTVCKKLTKNQVKATHLENTDNEITTDISKPIWHHQNQETNHKTQSNLMYLQPKECPICIEDNTDVVTACKHNFHINCLLSWFIKNIKNRNCLLCKRTKIENIKLFCKNCNNRFIVLSVTQTIKNYQKWQDFVNICDTCIVSPKVRGRASTRDTSFGKLNSSKLQDDIQIIQL